MPLQQKYIETRSGSRIALFTAGDTGPFVFVLGGLQGQSTSETPIAALLEAAAGFGARVAMMDLPGTGKSSFRAALTMELWLEDISEVYRSLGSPRAIWVGASMGGWLMLLLHRRHPEWFSSMCALAPAVDWDVNFIQPGIRSGVLEETSDSVMMSGTALPKSLVRSMSSHHVLSSGLKLEAPLRIIQGDKDETARPEATSSLVSQLGISCILELLPNQGHEVAKLETAEAMKKFAHWLRGDIDTAG